MATSSHDDLLSIEIVGFQQESFITYLEINATTQKTIKNFYIHIYAHGDESILSPSIGEFEWNDDENTFLIIIKEEGNKPLVNAGVAQYFKRIYVKHKDIEILRKFVNKSLIESKPVEKNKIKIFNSTGKGYWELNHSIYCQSFENIYIPDETKTLIISKIDKFMESKEKHIKYGIKYMLSFLLMGTMGSGKTSLVKAIAKKYKKAIYFLNFSKAITDEVLFELASSMKPDSILLVEDIDSFFTDRDPKNINISFSGFINIMDGVLSKGDGTIVFITANHPERIDSALIRPGRINMIIKFDYPKKPEIQKLFMDLIENATVQDFEIFYDKIKNKQITMSGIVNYLFTYTADYNDHINELLSQTSLFNSIVNDVTDKLYS